MAGRIRMAVLLSGSGRTLQNFLDLSRAGKLKAEVVKVISSLSTVYGLERARNAGVQSAVVRRKDHDSDDAFSRAITRELDACSPDLVALAGFICFYKLPPRTPRSSQINVFIRFPLQRVIRSRSPAESRRVCPPQSR